MSNTEALPALPDAVEAALAELLHAQVMLGMATARGMPTPDTPEVLVASKALTEVCHVVRAALAQPGYARQPQWQPPGPVTADHPLECLIVVKAVRQSDRDWWIGGSTFLPDEAPIAWVPHTAANRAAIDAPSAPAAPGSKG